MIANPYLPPPIARPVHGLPTQLVVGISTQLVVGISLAAFLIFQLTRPICLFIILSSGVIAYVILSGLFHERMSGTEGKMESKEKTAPTSDSRGSHGRQLSLSFREGISESANKFTLSYDESGSFLCKVHNKARSYSYPMSSSSSPPWSPLCSPAPLKSEAAIPFSWEDKPGVPKQQKAQTLRSCFGELPPPPPSSSASKFSIGRLKKRVEEADPFVSALVECTKQTVAAVSMSKGGAPSRRSKHGFGLTYLLHEFLRRHRRHSVLNSACCKKIESKQQAQPLEKIAEIPSKLEVC